MVTMFCTHNLMDDLANANQSKLGIISTTQDAHIHH